MSIRDANEAAADLTYEYIWREAISAIAWGMTTLSAAQHLVQFAEHKTTTWDLIEDKSKELWRGMEPYLRLETQDERTRARAELKRLREQRNLHQWEPMIELTEAMNEEKPPNDQTMLLKAVWEVKKPLKMDTIMSSLAMRVEQDQERQDPSWLKNWSKQDPAK